MPIVGVGTGIAGKLGVFSTPDGSAMDCEFIEGIAGNAIGAVGCTDPESGMAGMDGNCDGFPTRPESKERGPAVGAICVCVLLGIAGTTGPVVAGYWGSVAEMRTISPVF